MGHMLTIPHRRAHGMCPVNGIRDLVHWQSGKDWSNEFLYGLGQGGGFAYLRFKSADPPRQVYWGIAGPRQHKYLAELLSADYVPIENRSFKFSWRRAREAVDAGKAPVLGPLDMFHLHFYEDIYHRRHIPIHYVLLVGYEDEAAYVHDTDNDDVQTIPLDELAQAWDVNVPGLGKRNRLATFGIPAVLPQPMRSYENRLSMSVRQCYALPSVWWASRPWRNWRGRSPAGRESWGGRQRPSVCDRCEST